MVDDRLGVAEAKRRFSELIDRVRRGERFVVYRHGKPAIALVAPEEAGASRNGRPIGLAAVAGALSDWEELEDVVTEIYASRAKAREREVPDLD